MPPKKKNVEEEVEYYEDEDTYMEEGLSLPFKLCASDSFSCSCPSLKYQYDTLPVILRSPCFQV